MTIGTVRLALGQLAMVLENVPASAEAKGVRALEEFLPANKAAAGAFLKKMAPKGEVSASWGAPRIGDLLPVLEVYHGLLSRLASKAAAREFKLLLDLLQRHRSAAIGAFIKAAQAALVAPPSKSARTPAPTNEQIVADYVARLKPALGADRDFDRVFSALKADKAARKQEIVEIAKRLMSSPPSSLDRKKGLTAIQDLHRTAKGFDLKLKAMSGRSAA